jgi:hypothetical protein
MALQALQNQRRPEQHIEVTFDDREPSAAEPDQTGPDQTGPDQTGPDQTGPTQVPRTPDEVAPPAEIPAEAAAEDRTEDRAAAAEVTVPGQRAEPELPAGRDPAQSDRTQ